MTIAPKAKDHHFLSPIEEVVEDARNGRMFILVDAEERENEGDLVIPARGGTSFQILVPRESQGARLRVGVFDVAGRRVRSLVNRAASPGPAQIDWNLQDDSGHRVASGLYMMRVDIGDTRKTFRLVVVR